MALTREQKAIGMPLINAFGNLCLLQGTFKGQDAAFVCTHRKEPDGSTILSPRFMVLDAGNLDHCLDPDGRPLSVRE